VAAGFAGVGTTVLLVPMQIKLAELFAVVRGETAGATDQRVRYISEVIDGIASVKSYGWEKPFYSLIESLRGDESKFIAKSQRLRAINQGLYYCSAPVAAFVTFLVYWLTGNELTLPIVFSILAQLQVLRMIVGRLWTRAIETGSEAFASCYRIEQFLNMVDDEINSNQKIKRVGDEGKENVDDNEPNHVLSKANEDLLVSIEKSSFYYGDDADSPVIKDLDFQVHRGELLVVVGAVGAGKSSFLAAILDEIKESLPAASSQSKRYIRPKTRIAYCSQRPWILAASVRVNITLAGKQVISDHHNFKAATSVDEDLYSRAVECCRIVDDLNQWPAYDDTEVGERGISISGGQKARIALARAVYSDCELQVLDDPLSAVDAHVGQALFHHCIMDELRAKGKGVILATHQLQYLPYADKIVVLNDDGQQVFYGTYNELISRESEFSFLDLQKPSNSSTDDQTSASMSRKNSLPSGTSLNNLHVRMLEKKSRYDSSRRSFMKSINLTSLTKSEKAKMEKQMTQQTIIQAEDRVEGVMSFNLFIQYLRSGGILRGSFAISLAVVSQGLLMITEYWLRWWASSSFGDQSKNLYIIAYACLTVACIIMGFYRAVSWFEFTLGAANNLHANSLWAVMHSPLQFFIANPTGRILNRFSRDTNQTDELFPFTLFDFLQSTLFCIGAIALVCVSIPWLIIMIPFMLLAFYVFRKKYMCCAREIKRIDAITRSPIYADFSATLEGLVTLRAYELREAFTKLFEYEIDENGKAFFSFLMVSRWLGFRLDSICTMILILVAFLAVILRKQIDVGLIGFALVYTMSLAGLFQWTVRQSAEVESQMTAIERINAYSSLPPEPGYSSTLEEYNRSEKAYDLKTSDITSQQKGHLELKNLTVTYREDLDPVLKSISVDIPAGEKVGICGRTGSGKSSTLLALLRLNLVVDGDIIVDGESLLAMSLERARSIISVIPQDPHLFSGTVRFNLDPFSIYTDAQVWAALQDAHIADYISKDPLGLQTRVEESGKNFSVGQRQLLSLARAILRQSKVLLCDEVTASIDYLTDRLIQTTIRTSPALKSATIVTVAHRLRTIADSDKIVVIQAGNVVEYGRPADLLEVPESLFRALAVESGEFDEIHDIANKLKNVASLEQMASHKTIGNSSSV
jgi:ATP-binding cassette, subfamily C (CFTR/MRP), member 4